MKKLFALALAGGLLVGSIGLAEAKPRKATTTTYFLHYSGDSSTCGATFMDTKDGPDGGQGCGYVAQPANEVLIAAGSGLSNDWPAVGSVTLNSAKSITMKIRVVGVAGATAGQAILDVSLTGSKGGALVTLLEESKTMAITPLGSTFEFTTKIPKSLNGKKVSSISLNTVMHGASTGYYIDVESQPSTVTIPSFK